MQKHSAFVVSAAGGIVSVADQQFTDFSSLYDINDLGEVAGTINGPNSVLPFRAIRHTAFQVLPLLSGDTGGGAYSINASGESAGFSSGPSGSRATWWTRKGEVSPLTNPTGYTTTKAIDINARGDVAGYAGNDNMIALLWSAKGTPTILDTLANFTSTQPESLNDKGDVVGYALALDPVAVRMHAVLWPAGKTTPQDLGVISGGLTSRARDVDSNGVVVGTSNSSLGNRAFIWMPSSGMIDLNTMSNDPSITLLDALSINKQGVILAIGVDKSMMPAADIKNMEEHELQRQIFLLIPQ